MPTIVPGNIAGFTQSAAPQASTAGNVQSLRQIYSNGATGCNITYLTELITFSTASPSGTDELNSQALIGTDLSSSGQLTTSNWADSAFMGDQGATSAKVADVSGDLQGKVQARESMATGQAVLVSMLCPTGSFDANVWAQVTAGVRVNGFQDGEWPS
jgi:hypothetical protein